MNMTSDKLKQETAQNIQAVKQAPKDISFKELVKVANLDPSEDFRYCNFPHVDFSGNDLRGFDFTGANLAYGTFDNCLINGARFDAANLTQANLRKAKDWEEYRNSWRRSDRLVDSGHLRVSNVFQDAPFAPELVIIPSGSFIMGSLKGDGELDEQPQHPVKIDYNLAVGRFTVTFEEWEFYAARDAEAHKPKDEGWGRGRRPVINVSWLDAKDYIEWLCETTGETYRLLSEAEWEYACRACVDTQYYFGDYSIWLKDYAWYHKNSEEKTHTVGLKKPNRFGLYDMHGNVWELCEDDYHNNYEGAPSDGSAWFSDHDVRTATRVLRGGSWGNNASTLRTCVRSRSGRDIGDDWFGFRVAREVM